MSATNTVAELLRTELAMRHELWESCRLDDPETFQTDATRLLGDLTEASSRDLRNANWIDLWRDFVTLEYGEIPTPEPKIQAGARVHSLVYGYTGTVAQSLGPDRWLVHAKQRTGVTTPVEAHTEQLRPSS
ncbi:hypothetical protein [Streptomyces noursei]|uniref:hypothetical protein n=1 Tax=Streptomyces noursei TaxID=1971 RepID=UPI00167242EC|nr:hypothetical protein [Streptomyces noursei]MCZ1019722.1 hypothetical protein [Streptomyces noursei]GGX51029.1 hypothetical protein GCM10010341_85770 [Streptomyces noursei]